MYKKLFFPLIAVALSLSTQAQTTAVSFHSTNDNYWQMKTETVTDNVGTANIIIRTSQPHQTFKGWGTCFNELDYDAWSLLSTADRELFMKRVFNPNGDLRLNVGRIPVGASDYANDWYSCDETTADGTTTVSYQGTEYTVPNYATDFEMEHFTIERDRQKIIPSIKLALAENPDMTFWASPWSPPSWMKINKHYAQLKTDTNGCPFGVAPYSNDQFIDDPAYYNAYCLYFDKFIQAYKGEGINITGLAYQNEAYSNTAYPGCSWTAATTGKFLGQYLGPYMAEHQPDVQLIVGTMNTRYPDVYQTILNSTGVSTYCSQVGFQWEGGQQVANVARDYPDYELVQTESECGSGTFDWNAAAHTFYLCNHYLANGITTNTYWNAILIDRGYSTWGWRQNALVQVGSTTNEARYCPEYYAYKHYTHLIPEGSQILTCDETDLVTSALTPDGNVVVVIGNNGSAEKTLTIDIDGKALVCTLAPYSFASYVVGTETTVAKMLKSEAQGLVEVESASLTSAQTSALTSAISANTYSALAAAVSDVESHNTILNPSFSTDASGWTVANVAASGDFKQATVQGKTCFNNWSSNFTSMDIHQDLSGLAPGVYTVTAKSLCGEGNINDQHVYAETSTHLLTSPVKADDVWSADHWETQTTAPIYVAEGDYLRVGYASTSAGGTKGWFCVTDFELTRIGDLTGDFDLSVGRKADLLAAAKEAYLVVAEEARLLAVDETYVESYRTELAALITTQAAQLDDITVTALVGNLQRELEQQMAIVRAHLTATDFTATPLGEGTFLLWDATASQFLTYTPTATNEPALSDTPTRFILASNGEGTYSIKYVDVNYLKIGVWKGRYIFGDATDAANTKWIFTPVAGKTNHYTISTSDYAETGTSGTYYINGYNATLTAADAHEFILVTAQEYVRRSGNATFMVSNATTSASTGWTRDNNQAAGYAEQPAAIQSDVHTGSGISHWRGSAISNSNLIYQTISDLPAGTYKLEAYAAATVWNSNNGNDNRSGVSLFMAGTSTAEETAVTTANYGKYTVYYALAEDETLTLGLRAGASNQNNWIFLSDVTLTYYGQRLVLDENYERAPEGTDVDVLLQRTFYEGWNTLVLPFAMTSSQISDLLGEDAEVATFTSAETRQDGSLDVRFTKVDAIGANQPCLVYVPADVTVKRTIKNVNCIPAVSPNTDGIALSFTGTYSAYSKGESPLTTADYILGTGNTFKLATSGHAIKAYRAYLKSNSSSGVKASVVSFSINDTETGIRSMDNGQRIARPEGTLDPSRMDNEQWYDLSGRQMNLKRLAQKGIYITNGKKIIAK